MKLIVDNIADAKVEITKYFSRPGAKLARSTEINGGKCMYRTSDGHKCAVGCLIPDEEYAPHMEGATACHLLANDQYTGSFIEWLDGVQIDHDNSNSVEEFLEKLKAI